jgi:hypothetical protein
MNQGIKNERKKGSADSSKGSGPSLRIFIPELKLPKGGSAIPGTENLIPLSGKNSALWQKQYKPGTENGKR